jgi:hypothetical protein
MPKHKTRKMKHLNCSPFAKNKRNMNHSCFTPESLVLLKNAYNKHHANDPSKQIHSTDQREIWDQLNVRLPHCEKETCWLNQLNDANIQKQMEQLLFAPTQPEEWRKDPNTWLSNYDILKVLDQYEIAYPSFLFIGPTPIDFDEIDNNECVWKELCNFSLQKQYNKKIRKIGIIFNLDKHDESGSHWVSMFVDLDERFIFYFDSTGMRIPPEIKKLMNRIKEQGKQLTNPISFKTITSNKEHQMEDTECGMYSLFFLITMLTREIDGKKIKTGELLRIFTGKRPLKTRKNTEGGTEVGTEVGINARITDKYVEGFRNVYFNSGVRF